MYMLEQLRQDVFGSSFDGINFRGERVMKSSVGDARILSKALYVTAACRSYKNSTRK